MTNQPKSLKATAFLLAGVLATSCFVGGTMARYITTTSSEDSARVAVWGINADDVEMNLFASEYDVNGNKVAKSWDGDKIIAPGTSMASKFSIVNLDNTLAPEVMYEIRIDVDDTEIDQRILDNPSIQWKLDNNEWGTWTDTKADILALSGDASGVKTYQALEIADEFANGKEHTIAWQWKLDDNHAQDTAMGNQAVDEDITAKISVKVTARQVQENTTGLLNGTDQTFNVAAPTALTFRSAEPFAEFSGVKVDGSEIANTNYTVDEGSTVVTLKKEYLATLSVGTHKVEIISNNGIVSANFEVENNMLATDENGNYLVSTVEDLSLFSDLVNSGAKNFDNETVLLTADLDLKNKLFTPIGHVIQVSDSLDYSATFIGTFDGQGHTIKNLNIKTTDQDTNNNSTAGLFGAVAGGTIKNLNVDGATVTGTHFAGVIVGVMNTTTSFAYVKDCNVTNATVTSTYYNSENSGDKAGIIVGCLNGNYIMDSSATNSTVTASRDAGQITGAGKVDKVVNCTATDVTVTWNNLGAGTNIRNELIGRLF